MPEIQEIIEIGSVYHRNCQCDLEYIPIKIDFIRNLVEVAVRHKGKYLERKWVEPTDEIFSNRKE